MSSPDYSPNSITAASFTSEALPITYTIFPALDANDMAVKTRLWPDFVARLTDPPTYPTKAKCPLISCALYSGDRSKKGALRHSGAITHVYALEGDYDAERMSLTQAAQRLREAGVMAVLYSSPSSRAIDPKTGQRRGERWRVIAPLARPISPEARAPMVGLLNNLLKGVLTAESFNLSQAFYFGRVQEHDPTFTFESVPGLPIDLLLDELEAAGLTLEPVYPASTTRAPRPGRDALQDPRDKLDIVGAFCRTYSASEAIAEFLPHVFEPVHGDRYTWVGHEPGGVFIGEDGQRVGATHDSWPWGFGRAANTFDVVRQFLFDPELKEPTLDAPPYQRPSFRLMLDWMRQRPEFAPHMSAATGVEVVTDLDAYLERVHASAPPTTPAPTTPTPPPIAAYPGVMADMCRAIDASAHRQQPLLAVAATLGAMASACPGFYRLPSGGGLNLYIMGIVGTALGKDHPRVCATELARAAGAKVLAGAGMTGQGLEDEMPSSVDEAQPASQGLFLAVDELGYWLAPMTERHAASHQIILAGNLLKLFSASGNEYYGRSLANKPARRHRRPAVSLLGFTTPERLGRSVGLENIADGLLGRMLTVRGSEHAPLRRTTQSFNLPTAAALKAAELDALADGVAVLHPQGIVIGLDALADAELDATLHEFEQGATDNMEGALRRRSFEKVYRIAGVLAVWDNPECPVIAPSHVQWARAFVHLSNQTILGFTGDEMVAADPSEHADLVLSMCRRIASGEMRGARPGLEDEIVRKGGVPRALLSRCMKRMTARDLDAAIRLLIIREELVEAALAAANNKPATFYTLPGTS